MSDASAANSESQPADAQSSADAPPQQDKLLIVEGGQLREAFLLAAHWLEQNAPAINALNVFPVPDGDTGTNMLLTMQSAVKEIAEHTGHNASEIAHKFAQGAILGARGNSGVILSQILKGFASKKDGAEAYTAQELASALQRASENAYAAVMRPVEGTILTVARAMAEAATEAASETSDVRMLLRRVTERAHQALERTPEMLPVLKQAGVVDSGGKGLVTILEGISRSLHGEALPPPPPARDESPLQLAADTQALLDAPPPFLADGRYGYDIQYLVRGQGLDVEAMRAYINRLGDCPLVVGDESLVKVHVHALTPGPALDYGASQGALDDIVVENLDLQYEAFAEEQGRQIDAPPSALKTEEVTGVGIVAVAAGEGLAEHFRALGASAVVQGGQSMNPSTQDILDAIAQVQAAELLILPNNKNIILAAEQAQALSDRPVYVVPTRTVPQGFAALLAFDYGADGKANAAGMTKAISAVATGEVTTAVRTTTLNRVEIRAGDLIGLLDGQIVAAGQDDLSVVRQLLQQLDLDEYEIVSIFHGGERSAHDAQELSEILADAYPSLEFEVMPGGQPHYHYILAIE